MKAKAARTADKKKSPPAARKKVAKKPAPAKAAKPAARAKAESAPRAAQARPAAEPAPAAKPAAPAPAVAAAVEPKATASRPAAPRPASRPAAAKPAAPGRPPGKSNRVPGARSPLEGYRDFQPYRRGEHEEYMNTDQVTHFRQILTAWRQELMEEVDRTVHHMQDDASNFPDPNDRATQEEEFALELRTRDRERKLIKKINESLGALDSGDYGYCEVCGVEIGVERLEARPTATLCIDCKTLDEIREKQRA
ncbi:MAG: RNA polymerase-binding protein DksA [Gammaproteobacteria bacterium]